MINITITTTCLANGFNDTVIAKYDDAEAARRALEVYLEQIHEGLFKKFLSAQKRVRKGTSKGIKIFYSPEPGIRHYFWIKVTSTIEL